MRAVLVDPSVAGHLKIQTLQPPIPLPHQAMVRVEAISLNLGEVRRARRSAAGTLLGWDIAGTVVTAAADDSGPAVGTRVVGIVRAGAWAELVAVETACLAPLPDHVSCATAATLPVAGLTALYALEHGGHLLGRRVLVTGASGGVGYFAVQLATLLGAKVAGLIRQEKYSELMQSIGADWVVIGERASGAAAQAPYHCILESVGGQVLADSLQLLASDGVLVSYGISAGEQATIDAGDFFRAGRRRYYGLYLFSEFGRRPASDGLRVLVDLVADERLQVHIGAEGSLADLGDLAERLFMRQIAGKAVVHVD